MRVYGLNVRWWRLRGRTVICDRYLWDTLIDFRLNFPAEDVERWWLWRLLVRLSPQPDASFLLMIPVKESLRRSQEKDEPFPEPEEKRRQRYAQYQQLQQEGVWSVVMDATRPVDQVWAEIQAALQIQKPGF
jgi:thymidylate kinase